MGGLWDMHDSSMGDGDGDEKTSHLDGWVGRLVWVLHRGVSWVHWESLYDGMGWVSRGHLKITVDRSSYRHRVPTHLS